MRKEKVFKDNWYKSINELFKMGKYTKAMAELEEYMRQYPNDYYAQLLNGKILFRLDYLAEAESIFQKLIFSTKDKVVFSSMLQLAQIYIKKGKIEVAEELLNTVLKNDSLKLYGKYVYASLKIEKSEYKEAINLLKTIPRINDQCYVYMAKAFYLDGQFKNFRQAIDHIDIHNLSIPFVRELLSIYKISGMNDRAIDLCNAYEKQFLENSKLYYDLLKDKMYFLSNNQQYEEVFKIANEVLLNPYFDRTKEPYLYMGEAYQDFADYEKAKENYEIALSSSDVQIKEKSLFQLGTLYHQVGNFRDAKICYETYLELFHKDDFLIYMKLISIAIKEEEYQVAKNYIMELKEKCMDGNPSTIRKVEFLIDKKLNSDVMLIPPYSYEEVQFMNYQEEACKKHFVRGMKGNVKSEKMEALYQNLKEKLTQDNICYGNIVDVYEIELPNDNKKYRISTIPNTYNILTITPHLNKGLNRKADYEKIREIENRKKELAKQKRYEKFNM